MKRHPLDRIICVYEASPHPVITLRFSMKALAKMSRDLQVDTPLQLAEKLRANDSKTQEEILRVLFQSLCLKPQPEPGRKTLLRALPIMSKLIEEGFA